MQLPLGWLVASSPASRGVPDKESSMVADGAGAEHRDQELILVGTVHRDPLGLSRLLQILHKEKPAAVAVEVSPYALFYRQRNGRLLQRRLGRRVRRLARPRGITWKHWGQIEAVRVQLELPFEYRAARRHCRDTGAALYCLDSSSWSRHHIHTYWPQILSSVNLAALLDEPPENLHETVRRGYRLAHLLLSELGRPLASSFIQGWAHDPCWRQREEETARELARLFSGVCQGRLVYVGGWQHLLGPSGAGTLYERLAHLQPRRVLLHEESRPATQPTATRSSGHARMACGRVRTSPGRRGN